MKLPRGLRHIKVDIYEIDVFFCTNENVMNRARKKFKLDKCERKVSGLCTTLPKGKGYLVCVFDGSYGTLAHEMAHASFGIFEDCCIDIDKSGGNEHFTYLLGYLIDSVGKLK
jgi:hypothetical protein